MALKIGDSGLRAASAVVLAPAAVPATWAGGAWFCALVVASTGTKAWLKAPSANRRRKRLGIFTVPMSSV